MDRVPRFKLRGSSLVDAELGYWGWLLDLERFGSRGGAYVPECLRLGPRAVMVASSVLDVVRYNLYVTPAV